MNQKDTANACVWTMLEWTARNNKDEQDAILEYSYMLTFINENRTVLEEIIGVAVLKDIEGKVREHISDEEQHSKELTEIYVKLSGIQIADD